MGYFTPQIKKHRQDRNGLIVKVREVLERAEADNRALTAEERSEMDKLNGVITDHETRIADLERAEEQDGDEPVGSADSEPLGRSRFSDPIDLEKRDLGKSHRANDSKEYRAAFSNFLKTGEKRDVLLGTLGSGGYLVAPYQMASEVVQQLANLTFIRQLAKVEEVTSAAALRIPVITSRIADPAWTTEAGCITEDTSLAFSHVDLTPAKLMQIVEVSDEMVATYRNLDALVMDQLATKYSYVEENAYLNGSGSGQPLGVFTANSAGVSTARDVTGITTGVISGDDLIAMRYNIKQQYLNSPKCRWVMSRNVIAAIRTLKDSYGQYLLQMGLADNRPDTLIGVPVCVSEFAPSSIATGAYVAVLGDFSYYTIAEYLGGFMIQRLVELYANCGMVGFRGRRFLNGAPTQPEAFSRLKVH